MQKFMQQPIEDFCSAVASGSPSPGGGSAAAVAGALAASLVSMVSGLTLGRKKYAAVQDEMEQLGRQAAELSKKLGDLADADAKAYDQVMEAYRLPKDDESQKEARAEAIASALRKAADVPLSTARLSSEILELSAVAVEKGNVNARTDAGVAALLAEAALQAAIYNVRVNISSLTEKPQWAREMEQELVSLLARKDSLATQVRERVLSDIS